MKLTYLLLALSSCVVEQKPMHQDDALIEYMGNITHDIFIGIEE